MSKTGFTKGPALYAGFENHKTFDAFKADYVLAARGDTSTSDFVLRECWLAGMSPHAAHSAILAARADRKIQERQNTEWGKGNHRDVDNCPPLQEDTP